MGGVVAKTDVEGAAELRLALKELGDMQASDWKSTLKTAVRVPMMRVRKQAIANISSISPGKTEIHRTYLGREVTAGFASRSLRVVVRLRAKQGIVSAVLGVLPEAFYALSFFELGTSTIPRQPWLTPALEASSDNAVKEVGAAMRRRIEQIARKRMKHSTGGSK